MHRPESELVERLRRGDEDAFAEVVDRYHAQLVRFARTYVDRHESAEDVAQETWLAALHGLDRFEGRSSLRTWLFQICANRARTLAVRETRVTPADPSTDARFDDGREWVAPIRVLPASRDRPDDQGMLAHVRAAISELPDLQRRVVTLRDIDGLSPAQICDQLSLTPAHQRVVLHRGRAAVRRNVERRRRAELPRAG